MMKISFIGFGNMAKAIAHGLIKQGLTNIHASSLMPAKNQYPEIQQYNSNIAVVKEADVVLLAVKPNVVKQVMEEVKEALAEHTVIISVAAGISIPFLQSLGKPKQSIIRSMPNIAASIGLSATPLFANQFVTTQQKQIAETIFSSIGMLTWVQEEDDINKLTALASSGPAFIFQFMLAMKNAGQSLGLSENLAQEFTKMTFQGAVNLALQSELNLTELRNRVTSPQGTTAAGLDILHAQDFDLLIKNTLHAAYQRALALSKINK